MYVAIRTLTLTSAMNSIGDGASKADNITPEAVIEFLRISAMNSRIAICKVEGCEIRAAYSNPPDTLLGKKNVR